MLPVRIFVGTALMVSCAAPSGATGLSAAPAAVRLHGPASAQQIIAWKPLPGGAVQDLTSAVRFTSLNPGIAAVSPRGLVTPVADGAARIRLTAGPLSCEVPVTVRGARADTPPTFPNDILPILSRAGCNSGPCHGKAEGQNGFKLSVFGYDPDADHAAITRGSGARRIARTDPAHSLLLLKATGAVPHAGGQRFAPGSAYYRVLARWVAVGAPFGPETAPSLSGVQVFPLQQSLLPGGRQPLLVTARYSDGSQRDVTREARFGTNSPAIASVDDDGAVTSTGRPGEAAVMVSYRGAVAVCRIRVPQPNQPPLDAARLPRKTPVDALVWSRLAALRVRPSGSAADPEFLRRVYLDTIGALPEPEESRQFLADRDPAKREKLIDHLLERPEFADYWALKWADLLRVNKNALGAKGAYTFYRWIREAVAANVPYDRFVRELLTATGSSNENGAVNYFRVLSRPQEVAASTSQVFLGVRLECAQCHHHPFEKWSQDDYYGMVGFFTRLAPRPGAAGATVLLPGGDAEAVNPRTGKAVPPHPLLGAPADVREVADRRERLAEWMTRPDNPFLARMLVNRLWAHFMGRGLVEPVDDFRDTNPPTNPELLDYLARRFVSGGYDVKSVMRLILNSQVYQLSGAPNSSNVGDQQNFSRAYPKRLPAEVLLDALSQATGVPAELPGVAPGTRAVQMWDSEWSLQWQSYFLNAFGRPPRTSPCECERSQDPTVAQVLHLMNAPEIQAQLAGRQGRAHRLAESAASDTQVIEELFLAAYCRLPNPRELAAARSAFAAAPGDRASAAEDVLWALLNSVEFVFNH
jgi:hypothetical protein